MLHFKSILLRYGSASIGLLLVALGVALSIISNLGTSPLSCPAYVVSLKGSISVGTWTIIINTLYIFIQLAFLRKNYKWSYLMQIPATVVFGYMIDFCLWAFAWTSPEHFFDSGAALFCYRLFLNILSCAVTALGISIEVVARGWMLSAEMTVFAISETVHGSFDKIKVGMDLILVVLSSAVAMIMFHNPFGSGEFNGILGVITGSSEGVVIGLGTVLMAFLAGGLMRFTDPVANKFMDWIISKIV